MNLISTLFAWILRTIVICLAGKRLFQHTASVSVGRKRLMKSGRDSFKMSIPFVLWGALVVTVYSVSYTSLLKESEILVNLNLSKRVSGRMIRTLHIAHELAYDTTPDEMLATKLKLNDSVTELDER